MNVRVGKKGEEEEKGRHWGGGTDYRLQMTDD